MPDYDAIKAELDTPPYEGKSDQEAADMLNAPDPTHPVPAPLSISTLMSLIGPTSLAKLYPRPALITFRDDIAAGDRVAAGRWITLAAIAGDVTPAERDAVLAELARTVPGPSMAVQVFGVPLTHHDVRHARGL